MQHDFIAEFKAVVEELLVDQRLKSFFDKTLPNGIGLSALALPDQQNQYRTKFILCSDKGVIMIAEGHIAEGINKDTVKFIGFSSTDPKGMRGLVKNAARELGYECRMPTSVPPTAPKRTPLRNAVLNLVGVVRTAVGCNA